MVDSCTGAGEIQDGSETPCDIRKKRCLKKNEGISKEHRIHSEEAANGHSWNNVNLKVSNECIGLYLRKPNKHPQIHILRGRKTEDGHVVEEGQLFLTEKIPINKFGRNGGNTKTSSGKHHSSNCCRQNPRMDAKISG